MYIGSSHHDLELKKLKLNRSLEENCRVLDRVEASFAKKLKEIYVENFENI